MSGQVVRVPYTALASQAATVKTELMAAVESVLDSGRYILGPEVQAFEREFAALCDVPLAVGLANGTCALHLVLRAIGVTAGDEVITAPNSFLASASSAALTGARPVFVDVRADMNLDPGKLEDAITPRTKAIVPVHLAGRPAAMKEILEIADRRGVFVLEDSAQAVGARLDGRPVGGWGHAACFSLHPLKNLYAYGDAGMMTTRDDRLASHLRQARNHGLQNRDTCDFWSFNCRLDEIHAAMLRVHLRKLDEWTAARRRLALRYNDALRAYVTVPDEGQGEYHVYQTYMIQSQMRDQLQKFLNVHGIEALVHYATPIHLQPAARDLGYTATDFPETARVVSEILSLPLYPGLTEDQQDLVVSAIREFYTGRA